MEILFGDIKAITDLLLTAAITEFALGTWRATRSYARLAGLTLLLDNLQGARESDSGDRKMSISALRIVRAEFPDIFETIKPRINAETIKEIEGRARSQRARDSVTFFLSAWGRISRTGLTISRPSIFSGAKRFNDVCVESLTVR